MTPEGLISKRKAMDLTQNELATKLAITERQIRNYEKGDSPIDPWLELAIEALESREKKPAIISLYNQVLHDCLRAFEDFNIASAAGDTGQTKKGLDLLRELNDQATQYGFQLKSEAARGFDIPKENILLAADALSKSAQIRSVQSSLDLSQK